MPNLGPTELIVILVIALLVFGPKRLPDLGRSVGRGLREFKKARDEVTGAIKLETKDLGLDAKELGVSAKDFDLKAPLSSTDTAASDAAESAATPVATAAGVAAAATAAETAPDPVVTAGRPAGTPGGEPPEADPGAPAATTDDEPEAVADVAASEVTAAADTHEVDEVLHGEVVDDEPSPPSAPAAPSDPHDADPV